MSLAARAPPSWRSTWLQRGSLRQCLVVAPLAEDEPRLRATLDVLHREVDALPVKPPRRVPHRVTQAAVIRLWVGTVGGCLT